MLLFRFLLLELNTVFCHNSSSNHELFRHVVSKVFYSRMFLSTEGILLVSFPSKSYHFFCKCWELSKSTTFPFPKLSDKSELFTKHLCSFIRKKNQRFHIRLFSQISFAVEPFMPFLVIQKNNRWGQLSHWLQLNLMKRCVFFLWRCTPIFWLYTIPHLSQLL